MRDLKTEDVSMAPFGQVDAVSGHIFDQVVETDVPGHKAPKKGQRVRTQLLHIDLDERDTPEPVAAAAPVPEPAPRAPQDSLAPVPADGEAAQAIKGMVVEQRRERQRKALPNLAPSEPAAETIADDPSIIGAFKSAARQAKGDTFFLINVTLWSFLAIVALSNSSISASVILPTLFYLMCFACIFRPEIIAGVVREIWRSFLRKKVAEASDVYDF